MKSNLVVSSPQNSRPRRLKYLLIAAASAVLLMAIMAMSAWVYVRSENFNRYVAGEIKAKLREYGARGGIGGLGISWDTQTARLRDLKIYNDRTGQLLATIERADTVIEIPDLYAAQLSRRIVIKKIEVEGADLFYEVDPQGRTNLDGLRYVRSESKAITIDTTRLIASVSEGAIHVKDFSRRIEAEIQGLRATAEAQPQTPNTISLRFNSSAGKVNYDGNENRLGKFDLTARVSENRVEIDGLSLESNIAELKTRGQLEGWNRDWSALRYSFDFDTRVRLNEASRALALKEGLNGQAAVNGRIDGAGANYTIKGGASLVETSAANFKLSDARIPFFAKGKGSQISFGSDQILAQSATVETVKLGSIVINDLKGEYGSRVATITAPSVSVAAVEAPEGRIENISIGAVAAKISGSNFEVKGAATLSNGEIRGAQITDASAQVTLDNTALNLSDIKAAVL